MTDDVPSPPLDMLISGAVVWLDVEMDAATGSWFANFPLGAITEESDIFTLFGRSKPCW
jgi:hypothetical protein